MKIDLTQNIIPWSRYELFKKCLYILLLIIALLNLVDASAFYSNDGFIYKVPSQFNLRLTTLTYLMSFKEFADYYWVFLVGQILFLVLGLISKKFKVLIAFFVWFFTANIYHASSVMLTGGETLVQMLLFYMIFIQKTNMEGKTEFGKLFGHLRNNVFFIFCVLQVVLVYVMSAWFKWVDASWMSGEAVGMIAQIDSYSKPWAKEIMLNNDWIGKFSTYLALAYQTLFPLLVWFKKIKPYFLIIGIAFHLFIAFIMGIWSFGMIMIVVYLLFIKPAWLERVFNKLPLRA